MAACLRIENMDCRKGSRLALLALWGVLALPACLWAEAPRRPLQREDATLWAVDFVNDQLGWAVGDAGAIWHTADGGATWKPQQSPISCSLMGVDFLDAQHGVAVGGIYDPHTHTSRGVLLITGDGGQTWRQEPQPLLPALQGIKMLPPQPAADGASAKRLHGFAWGQPSGLHPSGLLATDDGGRTWTPVPCAGVQPGKPLQPWAAADFVDPSQGAVAGTRGAMSVVRRRSIQPSQAPPIGPRDLRQIKLQRQGPGWLAGDGGLILTTHDAGGSWQLPPSPLPPAAYEHFDFQSVETLGPHAWFAGTPGSQVLHTPDAGRTWQWLATGQSLPIHAIKFVSPERGFAVGALGTILATRDGGRSWSRCQTGGSRLAVLALFGNEAAVPWELLAQTAAGEGYLAHVKVIGRPESADGPAHELAHEARLQQAALSVGACGASVCWQYPLRPREIVTDASQVVAEWNRVHENQGLERLEEMIVRQIRLWQPEVIVTHAATPSGAEPLSHVLSQVVLRAAQRAADRAHYPQHLQGCGLQTWQVKKVLGALPAGQQGDFNVASSQVIPRLGRSLGDMAEDARGLICTPLDNPPAAWSFRLSQSNLPQGVAAHDVMSGISLNAGEGRRPLSDTVALESMRLVQQYQNVRNIIRRAEGNPQQRASILSQWSQLTRELPQQAQGQILFAMGQQHRAHGRWEEAAEAYETLVRSYPEHACVPAALVWLAQYLASGETQLRSHREDQVTSVQAVSGVLVVGEGTPQNVIPAGGTQAPPAPTATASLAAHKLAEVEQLLERRYPHLYAEPQVRFPLARAAARRGAVAQAERYFSLVRSTRPRDAWWHCAAGEWWLSERMTTDPAGESSPRQLATCVRTAEKPYLDGKLDDTVWLAARPLELASARRDDGEWGAVAYLAHDDEFLYVAATCRKAAGHKYTTTEQPRPRDGDLSAHDRVEFFLDVDRDAAVCYRLAVDHRGWPEEDCWGDRNWNPSWYIATDQNEAAWSFEAAIPLKELGQAAPASGAVWGLGIKRMVPGVGLQNWSRSSRPEPDPEKFGLLLWQ